MAALALALAIDDSLIGIGSCVFLTGFGPCVDQGGLELAVILLTPSLECGDCRSVPPNPAEK